MADKAFVIVKTEVKDIFDKSFKSDVADAMKKAIEEAINKTSDMTTKGTKGKTGFTLGGTLNSMKKDGDKQVKLEAKATIAVARFGGEMKSFNANAGATKQGANPNKLADETNDLASQLMDGMMDGVITQMEKWLP